MKTRTQKAKNPTSRPTRTIKYKWVPNNSLIKAIGSLAWISKAILHHPKEHSQARLASVKATSNGSKAQATNKQRTNQ